MTETNSSQIHMLFHGRDSHEGLNEDVVFFSTSETFSKDYGKVALYHVTFQNLFDTCSETDVTGLLKEVRELTDDYSGDTFTSFKQLEDSNLLHHDTWEIFEPFMSVIKRHGYDGMIIYEGGVQNYVTFSSHQYQPIHQ